MARRVRHVGDFDDEGEWFAQCGTPIDPDGSDDVFDRDAVPCDDCGGNLTCDGHHCPQHRGAFGDGNQFTFGVEIELESDLNEGFVETVTDSELIAGWDRDASLERNGVQYPRRPP